MVPEVGQDGSVDLADTDGFLLGIVSFVVSARHFPLPIFLRSQLTLMLMNGSCRSSLSSVSFAVGDRLALPFCP